MSTSLSVVPNPLHMSVFDAIHPLQPTVNRNTTQTLDLPQNGLPRHGSAYTLGRACGSVCLSRVIAKVYFVISSRRGIHTT